MAEEVRRLSLAEGVIEYLHQSGVDRLFANPGSTEVPLLHHLRGSDITLHSVLHEAVGVAMADGYAQATGAPAVVLAHATPGVANIFGGLFLARSHQSPVVILAGQQDSRLLLRRPFLASDVVSATREHIKWGIQAARAEEVLPALRRALKEANQRPKGPTLVSIPRDFYAQAVESLPPPPPKNVIQIAPDVLIESAAEYLATARAPVILAGNALSRHGREAIEAIVEVAELSGAAVHTEHNATGNSFPGSHQQFLGGNAHGIRRIANWFRDCDMVFAVGADLFMEDEYLEEGIIPSGCKVVQLDEDVTELNRAVAVDVAVAGDLVNSLNRIASILRTKGSGLPRVQDRITDLKRRRRSLQHEREEILSRAASSDVITAPLIYSELRCVLTDDDVIVDEAVNSASYMHEFFEFREGNELYSSKQSWLGWGIGASLGVQLANRTRKVVAAVGDGSVLFSIQALATAAADRIPVSVVVFNNRRYIAVANHLREYATARGESLSLLGAELPHVDFVSLSRGFGVEARRVTSPRELRGVLEWSYTVRDRPTLIDCVISPVDVGWQREPLSTSTKGET